MSAMNTSAGDQPSESKPSFWNLLEISLSALEMWPPAYIRSVLGPVKTWLPPHDRYSEFSVLDPWRLGRMLRYVADVSVPSLSRPAPRLLAPLLPPFVEDLFFHQSQVLHRPDNYGDYTTFEDERWFFINGILTNPDIAQLNAACISWLFHRPVTLIQNATDGFVADLAECALEKEWFENTSQTEAAIAAFPPIFDALTDASKQKVVIICHSQGTIITSVVLYAFELLHKRAMGEKLTDLPCGVFAPESMAPKVGLEGYGDPERIPLDPAKLDMNDFRALEPEEWAKLEIYFFATCANDIRYHSGAGEEGSVPYMEHFGNGRDLVAHLGMFAKAREKRGIRIDGPAYVRTGAYGHLLNKDYLLPIAAAQKPGRKPGGVGGAAPFEPFPSSPAAMGRVPRLYSYINGGKPEP
jgi:hypothetical protein